MCVYVLQQRSRPKIPCCFVVVVVVVVVEEQDKNAQPVKDFRRQPVAAQKAYKHTACYAITSLLWMVGVDVT